MLFHVLHSPLTSYHGIPKLSHSPIFRYLSLCGVYSCGDCSLHVVIILSFIGKWVAYKCGCVVIL